MKREERKTANKKSNNQLTGAAPKKWEMQSMQLRMMIEAGRAHDAQVS